MGSWFSTTNFSASDIPDLSGKVAIVTGGTAGLGLASAIELARKGAHVIITARNQGRGEEALAKIREALGNGQEIKVDFGIAENEDLKSMKTFAEWFLAKNLPLHILMLNAGVGFVPYKVIEDTESTLFINHVAHHLLAMLLLPKLRGSAPSRIVVISSDAYKMVQEVDLQTPTKEQYSGMKSYGNSKLANILFTRALQKRLNHDKIFANAIHPGPVATNITSKLDTSDWVANMFGFVLPLISEPSNKGVLTQLYAATSPEIEDRGYKGQYFYPTAQHRPTLEAYAEDDERAERLWAWTEEKIESVLSKPAAVSLKA